MTRRRHLAAPLAPVAALLLAACAAKPSSAPTAPSADRATSMEATSAGLAPNDLEGQLAALGAAEAQLDLAIRRSPLALSRSATDLRKKEERDDERSPQPKTSARAAESEAQKGVGASADSAASADPCATACSALSSMERATKHLCDLTGDGDARCDSARSRVSGATARVTASCPACAESR
ncbi:MAG: hypothetical protein ABI134_35115 [Byssovorax sp.]